MDIQKMMDFLEQTRKNKSANLTIGKMLQELKDMPQDANIKIDMGFSKALRQHMEELFDDEPEYAEERAREFEDCQLYFTNSFYSYRGYYCDMAIDVSKEATEFKVKDMIKLLNNEKEEAIMEGYKGGEFSINDNTILWLEIAHNEANGIAPIMLYKINENEVVLITKYTK